ncbi:ROK family protein [Alloscardovia macacae]|uniref:NagC family transcriptional regulator n=1 Tax=Alloscardovia macacae TaxID=1160091 RepID=A0A261F3K4_9BIFI|nr:ROK family protein [Alloscardovia macacae]OZG53692.1 NagC family transcriptional regulator [Alloscardovia macacae]
MTSQRSESMPSGVRVGIDVGGTKIAGVALASESTDVLAEYEVPARQGSEALVEDVLSVVRALSDDPVSIGIGTPGRVNSSTGEVENIANLAVDYVDLGRLVAAATCVEVHVENDVNAAALGVAAQAEAASTVVCLSIGTGIAAGVVRNGVLDRGFSGVVGEVGHVPIEPHRWPCPCGQVGCLETAGSGGAAVRLWPHDTPPMPAIIRRAHDANDPLHMQAVDVRDTVIRAIVDIIDMLAVTVDPEKIILAGGMAKTGQPLLDEICAELSRRAEGSKFITSLHLDDRLALAPSGVPVGAIGAALCGKN